MTRAAVTEYLAECLWPGVTEAQLADLDRRVRTSTQDTERASVHYLGTVLMPNDEVVFFVFSGPSANAVRVVAANAAIPFERIVASVRTTRPGRQEGVLVRAVITAVTVVVLIAVAPTAAAARTPPQQQPEQRTRRRGARPSSTRIRRPGR